MGFLKNLFSRKPPRTIEVVEAEARALLDECRGMADLDPQNAAEMLRRAAGSDFELVFDFGADMHTDYVNTTLAVLGGLRAKQGLPSGPANEIELPTVVLADDTETTATGLVRDRAENSDADVVFIRALEHWDHWVDTLISVEALCEMTGDKQAAAVFVAEEYVLVRRDLLLQIIDEVDNSTPVPEMVRIVGDWFEESDDWRLDETVTLIGYDVFPYRKA